MNLFFRIFFVIYSSLLVLIPLNVFAEDKTFTCKPVVAGSPKKNGNFYVEGINDESTPMLDVIPDNQLLLRGEAEYVYFKNNSSRNFEALVPYKTISDTEMIKDIHEGLSNWDNFISLENSRTYYLSYFGDDGSHSLKRISINKKNTKTAILTIPLSENFPSYFSLFNCKSDNTNKPIEVEWPDSPSKKIS